MDLFGYELTVRRRALPAPAAPPAPPLEDGDLPLHEKRLPLAPLSSGRDSWWPIVVREPSTGAWQRDLEIRPDTLLSNPTVFTCVTRIPQDVAKCRLRLVYEQDTDIWVPTTNPAYSPVLRRPNHYQTIRLFIEQWIQSKLIFGNTYVLKRRDARGVVNGLYILNPPYVSPLVAPDGSVFYELRRPDTDFAGLWPLPTNDPVTVPARELIHDRINCLFHPLVGLSPLYAAGAPALLASMIQRSSTAFFGKGSAPSGVLQSDLEIKPEQADKIQEKWQKGFGGPDNAGKIAVLGYGLKYEATTRSASDSQLVDQQQLTQVEICECFGMPVALIDTTKGAPYGNREQLVQQYHDECLQTLMVGTETALDEGIGIEQPVNGVQYGTEFDIDDLIWMDTATRTKAAGDTIGNGALSPNEARRKYFGVGPAKGGASPMVQQQYYSLAALAERDAAQPFAKPAPATPPPTDQPPTPPADGGA